MLLKVSNINILYFWDDTQKFLSGSFGAAAAMLCITYNNNNNNNLREERYSFWLKWHFTKRKKKKRKIDNENETTHCHTKLFIIYDIRHNTRCEPNIYYI